ncbi:hypothetical protein [Sphingobium nicotianae]|uniref:Uncharacterized protein n=1 Tax=Sphingobium nicotianae TaxID=2782607 RepID=A0A9X1IQL2_9SPHN|nr:hypothetical protein [Sphingobium nicotianae]MBT2186823.1 hypothetical protein [Sphingobium nicotianae]
MTESLDQERLAEAARHIRASSGLGRSDRLGKLFDYILERTLRGEAPKEIEIAADIFGRTGSDVVIDASVRVYAHRLRKKLEDFYAGPGRDEPDRLALPKGEYRFRLVTQADAAPSPPGSAFDRPQTLRPTGSRLRERWAFLLAGLLAGCLLAFAVMHFARPVDALQAVRETRTWAPLLASSKPLTIVTGDYYIMGERDSPGAEPKRLVRDFAVNSREDLYQMLMYRPELRDRYVDLNLYYLPVSTAYALKSIVPVLTPSLAARRFTPLVPSSALTTPMLKNSDIVYIGLLSGLGTLEQPVFAGSRFSFAGSYDEIIDGKTGKVYVSDPPQDGQATRRNYAYIAMLPGPNGSRILILAGTRDPAVLQAADILTTPDLLDKLSAAGKDGYFEALYAVEGVGSENLRGTLIAASARSIDGMWDAVPAP